jgi:S1-C subfamily serine protease
MATDMSAMKVSLVSPFRLLVARSEVGRKVRVRLLREGRPQEREVTLTERPEPAPELPGLSGRTPLDDLGLLLAPLFDEPEGGVLVDSVLTDGPAYRAGIRGGDIILEVGWERVGSPADLRRSIRRSSGARNRRLEGRARRESGVPRDTGTLDLTASNHQRKNQSHDMVTLSLARRRTKAGALNQVDRRARLAQRVDRLLRSLDPRLTA